jgi:hypothetical protein
MKDKELTNAESEWKKHIHDRLNEIRDLTSHFTIDDLSHLGKYYEESHKGVEVEGKSRDKFFQTRGLKITPELAEALNRLSQVNYPQPEDYAELAMDIRAALTKPDLVDVGTSTQAAESTAPVVLPPQPPLDAEFVLHLLLNKDEQDALIGDLIERYGRKCERLGVRRANLWFYAEVVRTAWPLVKRFVAKAGGMLAVGEWLRRHIS